MFQRKKKRNVKKFYFFFNSTTTLSRDSNILNDSLLISYLYSYVDVSSLLRVLMLFAIDK